MAGQSQGLEGGQGASIYRESLRLLVLRVLAEGPMHGYQVIKRIEEVTGGKWRPAAGTLYPILEQLRQEGLVDIDRVVTEGVRGGRKVIYRLTDKGWQELGRILVEKARSKLEFFRYYVVEGCIALKEKGLDGFYKEVCDRLRAEVAVLQASIEEACS